MALAACGPSASETKSESPQSPPPLATTEQRFSYGVGAKVGSDLRASGHQVDRDALIRGVEDGLADRVTLSEKEIAAALQAGVESRDARQTEQHIERAREAEETGKKLLEENRARPGVVSLESGVQYEVIREGAGALPTIEDFVTCHMRGALADGTVFEDTQARGEPRKFAVTSVVDGLEEALVRMPVGSRWKVWVPPELGYGPGNPRVKIPANATLVFEVELLAIGR